MPEPSEPQVDTQEATPGDLAETLEALATDLAKVLPEASDDQVRDTLQDCLERVRRVSSSLRSMALVFDPTRASLFAKQGEGLRTLASTIGESVEQLSQANHRITADMGDHVRQLDQMAELPPGEDLAERLKTTVDRVRKMAGEVQSNFQAIASKVESANEGISTIEQELTVAREKAIYDSLTRLHSRAALDEHLDAAIRGGETKGPWCFLIIDIDHFKQVNDTHGHVVGDALLFKVARLIEGAIRWKAGKDFLARYGGEEFAVVLAGATLKDAANVAERIRKAVGSSRWKYRAQAATTIINATVSLGVAQYRNGDTAATLIERADKALYRAKKSGRNRTVVANA
ncbi:MAG: GGDEF domain-containing protein [Candidatus Brocadiia bacterium]